MEVKTSEDMKQVEDKVDENETVEEREEEKDEDKQKTEEKVEDDGAEIEKTVEKVEGDKAVPEKTEEELAKEKEIEEEDRKRREIIKLKNDMMQSKIDKMKKDIEDINRIVISVDNTVTEINHICELGLKAKFDEYKPFTSKPNVNFEQILKNKNQVKKEKKYFNTLLDKIDKNNKYIEQFDDMAKDVEKESVLNLHRETIAKILNKESDWYKTVANAIYQQNKDK